MLFWFSTASIEFWIDDENGDSRGVLSYTFAKGIQSLKWEKVIETYLVILNLDNKISPSQEPQAEGDLDVEVFFGNIVNRKDEIQEGCNVGMVI